jgi:chromosome transmission fidelity protein 18
VLRPLRRVAEVVALGRPAMQRLLARLRTVCAQEGLRADTRALLALIARADGDLRACLHTLQVGRDA